MADIEIDAEAFKKFELASWSKPGKAEAYDTFFGPVTRRAIGSLLDAAHVVAGTRVLDLASGPGYVAAAAARRGALPIGVDVSSTMVALASRLNPALEFIEGDADNLPFPDAAVDAVVANFLFLHLADPRGTFSEVVRVIRPGGWAAATVWDFPEHARLFGLINGAIEAAGAGPPADLPAGPPFFMLADDGEFTRLFQSGGLESISIRAVRFTHRINHLDALWQGMRDAGVRTAALIQAQTDATRDRIRAELERLAQPYAAGDGFEIPVSIKVASGMKPG